MPVLSMAHRVQASEKATKAKDAGVQKKKATPKERPAAKGEVADQKPAAKKTTKASPAKKQGAKAAQKKGATKK